MILSEGSLRKEMSFSEGGCLAKIINSYSTYTNPYDKLKAGLLPKHGTYTYQKGLVSSVQNGNFDLAEYLLAKPGSTTYIDAVIVTAAKFNNIPLFYQLIDQKINIDLVIQSGNLPLLKELDHSIEPYHIWDAYSSHNDKMIEYVSGEIEKLNLSGYDLYKFNINKLEVVAKNGDELLFNKILSFFDPDLINKETVIKLTTSIIQGLNLNIFKTWLKIRPELSPLNILGLTISYRNNALVNMYMDDVLRSTYTSNALYIHLITPLISSGQVQLLSSIFDRISYCKYEWGLSLLDAINSGSLDTVKFVVQMCSKESISISNDSFIRALKWAIIKGGLDMIIYLGQFVHIDKKTKKHMRKNGMFL